MRILVFLEGTVTMHGDGAGVSREERVEQARRKVVRPGYFADFVPVDGAVRKLELWRRQGATVSYLTSRRTSEQIDEVKKALEKYRFPEGTLLFRKEGESYAVAVEKAAPDVFIEDDCESIGADEIATPHLSPEARKKIKTFVVKEFAGIDDLPDDIQELA